MEWIKVLDTAELPVADAIKLVKIAGKSLCIVNHEGKITATQAYCPHAGGQLIGGWCSKGFLICPIHRFAYNLTTGRGAEGQGDYINIYPTELRLEGLFVGFNISWWRKIWKLKN